MFLSYRGKPEVNIDMPAQWSFPGFKLIVSFNEEILSNINLVVWRQVKKEIGSLLVAVSDWSTYPIPNKK